MMTETPSHKTSQLALGAIGSALLMNAFEAPKGQLRVDTARIPAIIPQPASGSVIADTSLQARFKNLTRQV